MNLQKFLSSNFVRLLALVLVLCMVAALFVGGAQPGAGNLFNAPWDKVVHVVYFFVFALLLRSFIGLPALLVIVLALALGLADEVHQSYLPGRTAAWDDFAADALGVLLALGLAGLIFPRE